MKKTLFLLAAASLLTSCYEDKGNYDYSFATMNAIDSVQLVPKPLRAMGGDLIEFTQPLSVADTLQRIEVRFNQSVSTDLSQLDFQWMRSYRKGDAMVRDTITTPGYLDLYLPVGAPMSYDVMLRIYDRSTTLSHYEKFKVATRPIFKNSLFFLHGEEGNVRLGNVEQLGGEIEARSDAYALLFPTAENPVPKANRLFYLAMMDISEFMRPREANFLVATSSDGDSRAFYPFGLQSRWDNYKNFVLPQTNRGVLVPDQIGMTGDPSNQSNYYYLITKDGQFATARHYLSFKTPNTDGEKDYRVEAGAIGYEEFLFWDAKYNRFLHINKDDAYGIWRERDALEAKLENPIRDARVDFSQLPEGMSPVGKKALFAYVQYREDYEHANPLFIFRDTLTGRNFLYELHQLAASEKGGYKDDNGKGGGGNSDGPAYDINVEELQNFDPSNPRLILFNTYFPTNYLFYTKGGSLIRYNTNNGDNVVLYTAPAGYEIACMKLRQENTFVYSGDLGLYLSLGLNKGENGAVVELKFNTNGDLDKTFPSNFVDRDNDGVPFGKILDVQFVHEYSYQTPDYMQ